MEEITKMMGVILTFLGAVFVGIILGPLVGGAAAWVIGLVFGDTILGIASQFGIKGVSMFQLGVFFGFIGSFLRTKTTVGAKGHDGT